jgi:alkaline ceramidase
MTIVALTFMFELLFCLQLFCDIWRHMGVPFLHGVWHVLISLAGYIMIVLFAYFDTADNTGYTGYFFEKGGKNSTVSRVATLAYWPAPNFEFGVPYVKLNKGTKYQL